MSKWYAPATKKQGKQRFAIVPVQFMLDPAVTSTTSQKMFFAMCQFADAETGLVGEYDKKTDIYKVPTVRKLAAIAGVNYTNGSRAMKQLIDTGWIRVKRRMDQAWIRHVQIPPHLSIADENGDFTAFDKSMSDEEFEGYREIREKRIAAKNAPKDDNFPTMTDEEVAAYQVERAAAIAEMNKSNSEEKSKRIYMMQAVRDVAMFIATGKRTYSDDDVAKFYLSYSMTEEELKAAVGGGFEHCYEDIFENICDEY